MHLYDNDCSDLEGYQTRVAMINQDMFKVMSFVEILVAMISEILNYTFLDFGWS